MSAVIKIFGDHGNAFLFYQSRNLELLHCTYMNFIDFINVNTCGNYTFLYFIKLKKASESPNKTKMN